MTIPEYWGELSDHLNELRKALIYSIFTICLGFFITLFFYRPLFDMLTSSYTAAKPLLFIGPLAGLNLTFKICLWTSLVGTCPCWCWIWLKFILPGLKTHEQTLVIPVLIGSLICLSLGIMTTFSVTIPLANQYLLNFNATIGENAWTLNFYLDYVLLLVVGHCVTFEIGFLLLLLVHYGFIHDTMLCQFRRIAIVIAFVLGALLTPPDVLTQLMIALPLIGLYEVAVWYAKWLQQSAFKNLQGTRT